MLHGAWREMNTMSATELVDARRAVREIHIQRADEGDAPALSRLAVRTFYEAFGAVVPPDAMAAYLSAAFSEPQTRAELADPDTVFLLAADGNGMLLGYAKAYFGAVTVPVAGVAPVKLWRLYTVSEAQGRGVGAALLTQAVEVVRERGGATLYLTVNQGNTGAIRFYERHGFGTTGTTQFQIATETHHDFVMERALPLA